MDDQTIPANDNRSPRDAEPPASDPLTSLLIEYQQMLVFEGPTSASAPPTDEWASADLQRAQDCLLLLEKARLSALDVKGAKAQQASSPFGLDVASAGLSVIRPIAREEVAESSVQRADASLGDLPTQPVRMANSRIGRFQILRELGSGGHGLVLLAHDPLLERDVALKIPRPEYLLTREARERFAQEARIAARLQHPNLVPVFEVGEIGPVCFIASAYCDGPTLAAWMLARAKPAAPRRAAEWLKTLAAAVHYAHSQGVLHRDLKPANVLLVRSQLGTHSGASISSDDPEEHYSPQITDFGLAKLTDGISSNTRTGTVLGTAAYMAPEQAAGRASAVSAASDTYSLGAILYELLTGRPPFVGEFELETLRQIQSVEPLAPRRLQPNLPRDLETICLKCLEKEPARRYSSAMALAEDLDRYLNDQPIQARPPTLVRRAGLWVRRHPARSVVLTCVGAVLLGLPIGLGWHSARLERERSKAVAAQATAEESARIARENELRVRQHVYVADMRNAQQQLREGDVASIKSILTPYRAHADPKSRTNSDTSRTQASSKDMPGFEWRYFDRLDDACVLKLSAHDGPLDLLAWSDRGDILATSGKSDGRLCLWEFPTGRLIHRFPILARKSADRGAPIAALSSDGHRVAAAVDSRTVTVWDTSTQAEAARFDHNEAIQTIGFSHDGVHLVIGDKSETVLWNCDTRERESTYPASCKAIIAGDDRLLMTVDAKPAANTVRLWDLPVNSAERAIHTGAPIQGLASSPAGDLLAVINQAPEQSYISVRHSRTTAFILNITEHGIRYDSVAFSGDGRIVAATSTDGALQFWDVRNGLRRGTLRGPATRLDRMAFSSDNRWLATSTPDGRILIWDRKLIRPCEELLPANELVGPMKFSADGKLLAAGTPLHEVVIADAISGRSVLRLPRQFNRILDLDFSPDARRLVTTDEHEVCCWNLSDGSRIWAVETSYARCVAWSPRDDLIATGGADFLIRLHRTWDGSEEAVLGGHGAGITALRFLPGMDLLVSAGEDSYLRFWDLQTRSPTEMFPLADGPILELAGSVRGRVLVSGHPGKLVLHQVSELLQVDSHPTDLLWAGGGKSTFTLSPSAKVLGVIGATGQFRAVDVKTNDFLYTLSGRHTGAASATFGSDDQSLATISLEGCLTLWDIDSWRARDLSGSPLLPIHSIAFSPDGATLAIGEDDAVESDREVPSDNPAVPNIRTFMPRRASIWRITNRPVSVDGRPWRTGNPGFRLWNLESSQEALPTGSCTTATAIPIVAWSPKGIIAAGSNDGTIWIWNADGSALITRLAVDEASSRFMSKSPARGQPPVPQSQIRFLNSVRALAFSPDGGVLAAATKNGTVRVFDTSSWHHELLLNAGRFDDVCLAFSPSGNALVASRGQQLYWWQVEQKVTSEPQARLQAGDTMCSSVAFDPSGRTLAIGFGDGAIELLDVEHMNGDTPFDRVSALRMTGHLDRVTSLSFSADGRTLASGSWDETVRLWHVPSGQQLVDLKAHRGKVHCVAFSPDDTMLVTAGQQDSDHGEIFVWKAPRD